MSERDIIPGVRSRELSVAEVEAAAAVAIELFKLQHPVLAASLDEASFKMGFVDGCGYLCDVLQGKK